MTKFKWIVHLDIRIKLYNCTPHGINIIRDGMPDLVFPKGEKVPRLRAITTVRDVMGGIKITGTNFQGVEDMPDEEPGTFFIVSRLVKQAFPNRRDLLVPNEIVRDDDGNIIGCRSLSED